MTTDISEKGFEPLVMRHLAGRSLLRQLLERY